MRLRLLAPFALLLIAPRLGAQEGVVELQVGQPAPLTTVSWQLPAGFEESELLLEIDGGPRVRLTDELREDRPRVEVRMPALAGMARFVVRAGRKTGRGRHEEVDLASSGWFVLSAIPASGPMPVLARASRPVPGSEMEWWSETAGRIPQGPSSGVDGPAATTGTGGSSSQAALGPDRPDTPGGPGWTEARSGGAGRPTPHCPERALLERTFGGAPVPLRN